MSEGTSGRPGDDEAVTPAAGDAIGEALAAAAKKAGIDPEASGTTSQLVWKSIGGVRGILESVLPSLAFVVLYTFAPEPLILSLGVSVGLAALFTILRIVQKSPTGAAVGGFAAVAASAVLALVTGRGQEAFVFGLITNGFYATLLLVTTLLGWSLIGVAAGFLMGEGNLWRTDARKRRAFFWLGLVWAALFLARLAVQLPLYFAGDVTTLGTLKLIMGLPLFAPLLAVTWLVVRALYPQGSQRAK